jgi:hypothetical protein
VKIFGLNPPLQSRSLYSVSCIEMLVYLNCRPFQSYHLFVIFWKSIDFSQPFGVVSAHALTNRSKELLQIGGNTKGSIPLDYTE